MRGPSGHAGYFAGCVWLEVLEGDWLLDGVELADPLVEGSVELELSILPAEPLVVALAPRSELPVTDELLPGVDVFEALEPLLHCCCAACVLGPMTPSMAPGSQPCDFNCCCS